MIAIEKFIEKFCLLDTAFSIHRDILYKVFQVFLKYNNYPLYSKPYLTNSLRKYDSDILIYANTNHGTIKYQGITLNNKGFELLNLIHPGLSNIVKKEFQSNLLTAKKIKNIDTKSACILLSCNPTTSLLLYIIKAFKIVKGTEEININYSKCEIVCKNIEKALFHLNKYTSAKVKVATAIYLTSPFSQILIAELCETTATSIRNLINRLKLAPTKYSFQIFRWLHPSKEQYYPFVIKLKEKYLSKAKISPLQKIFRKRNRRLKLRNEVE